MDNDSLVPREDLKIHLKLEFDIKTNMKDFRQVLEVIKNSIEEEFLKVKENTEVEIIPTIIDLTYSHS